MTKNSRRGSLSKLLARVDLQKYLACENFQSKDWYVQFEKRRHYLDSDRPANYQGEPASLRLLIENPLKEWVVDSNGEPISQAVRDTSLLEIWREKRNIELCCPDIAKELNKLTEQYKLDGMGDDQLPLEYHSSSATLRPKYPAALLSGQFSRESQFNLRPVVTINLQATDEQLKEQFSSWLEQRRNEHRKLGAKTIRTRPFDRKDFNKWRRLKVLPYLDILIATRMSGLEVTQRMIGDKLYSDEDIDTTERVRKTLEPLVKRLLIEATPANFRLIS